MEYHYLILFFMVGKLAVSFQCHIDIHRAFFKIILIYNFQMVSGNEKDLAPVKLDHSNFIQLALGLNINLDALKERQSGSVNSILGDPDTPLSPLYRDSCDGLSGIFCQDCSTLMVNIPQIIFTVFLIIQISLALPKLSKSAVLIVMPFGHPLLHSRRM